MEQANKCQQNTLPIGLFALTNPDKTNFLPWELLP